MASAWLLPPSQRRVPERLHPARLPPVGSGQVATGRPSESASALPSAVLFRPKGAGRPPVKLQLPFPACLVQVPFVVRLHTHFSCLGTCGTEIKRRLWLPAAVCQGKRHSQVPEWLSKYHDGHQHPQDHDDNRQQINVVRQPGFLRGHDVGQEGRHWLFGHCFVHRFVDRR
jgi:hypothetical protein